MDSESEGKPSPGKEISKTQKAPKTLGQVQEQTISEISDLLLSDTQVGDDEELKPEDHLTSSELAKLLFSKAPEEFLTHKSSTDLCAITEKLHSHIQEFLNSDEMMSIEMEAVDDRITVYMVIGDRPFVTNSARECILDAGGLIDVYLHPIIIQDGRRVSCSYIELSGLSAGHSLLLKTDLIKTLENVLLATDDYTAMLVQVETLARLFESERTSKLYTPQEKKTTADFLRWLSEGGYLITGLTVWDPFDVSKTEINSSTIHTKTQLGVHKVDNPYGNKLREELIEDIKNEIYSDNVITVSRLHSISFIQRRTQLLTITVRERSSDGRQLRFYQLSGLLTSKALAEESSSVPFLRERLQELLDTEGVIDQSHDYKNLVNIFNSMPKEELLRLQLDDLREVANTILTIQNRNDTRVSVRFDRDGRSASVLIVMPRDRFNASVRDRIQEKIETVFHAVPGSSEYQLDLSNKPHARFYFHIPVNRSELPDLDISQLKVDIAELTRGWIDNLKEKISQSTTLLNSTELLHRYGHAFAEDYQALQSVEDCEYDLSLISRISDDMPIRVGMRPSEDDTPGSFILILCKAGDSLTISQTLPILENAGLEVLSERSFTIKPFRNEEVALHRFHVRTKATSYLSQEAFENYFAPGLEQVLNEQADDDQLNSLFVSANLTPRSISMLRCYCALLWQIDKFATYSVLLNSLSSVPTAANQLWNMFEIKFNPQFQASLESRQERFQVAFSAFQDSLRDVNDVNKERILNGFAQLLLHTVRTNFYQDSRVIALKIQSEHATIIPAPRPKFEIFVKGPNLEGTHLRSSNIARGGLRWSDRTQDFRQEILDLVKTQNVKNALIVPSGSKGGFVVRNLPPDPSQHFSAAQSAYKEFIRALLSVTDNRVDDVVVHPDKVIAYDGEDPYFVVAADKGTATFSDLANEIAQKEFNFWLGDAFASGGTNGYDHKKYGITARGAWESVKRHFSNIGIDYDHRPFTVIGIGDMSGDVFGNGMLLNRNICLVAAFNHKHIFLDPNPDPEKSYLERERLFQLSRSQWSDYDPGCISEGGGVYLRTSRGISITPEIRAALELPESVPEQIDGEMLIHHILQAPVDLLWNGGIGTYVKASTESHTDASDVINDRVRINANELRAKIVGEGGNLGLTQLARIEFAKRGGHINTDAVDNSGGVDLSDHEVNLKILFRELIQKGQMTMEERNVLLREISEEVVDGVLDHNKNHALGLTIAVRRSRKNIAYYKDIIRRLNKRGTINRRLNYLPDDDELNERAKRKEGLWKPELAICLSAVKIWVKEEITSSSLPEDPLLQSFLLNYFPEKVRNLYSAEILDHPLAFHIIATEITNDLIDFIGITFVYRMCRLHSTDPVTVIKCTLVADFLLGGREIRKSLRNIDTHRGSKHFLALREELNEALRDITTWCIRNHPIKTLNQLIELYKERFFSLIESAPEYLTEASQKLLLIRKEKYTNLDLNAQLIHRFSCFPHLVFFLDLILAADEKGLDPLDVAKKLRDVSKHININEIFSMGSTIEAESKWDIELLSTALHNIRRGISLLACVICVYEKHASIFYESELVQDIHTMLEELRDRSRSVIEITVLAQHVISLPDKAEKLLKHYSAK